MSSEICIAGIGEVLVDVFESGEVTVGGAPFNVTFHLHQLLAALSLGEGAFVSAVGPDSWGFSIRRAAERAGMSTRYLAEVDRPTGSALVFERDGGAGFEIRADVAWDCICVDDAAMDLAARCNAVVLEAWPSARRSHAKAFAVSSPQSEVTGCTTSTCAAIPRTGSKATPRRSSARV